MQFKRFYTFVINKRKTAQIAPISINSQFVRIEIVFLVPFKADWYRAGYLTQIVELAGKQNTYISKVCPIAKSLHEMDNQFSYKLQFKPVPYLPPCLVNLYRSIDT